MVSPELLRDIETALGPVPGGYKIVGFYMLMHQKMKTWPYEGAKVKIVKAAGHSGWRISEGFGSWGWLYVYVLDANRYDSYGEFSDEANGPVMVRVDIEPMSPTEILL